MIDRAWDSERAEHTIYEPCPECFALVPFNQILYQSALWRAMVGGAAMTVKELIKKLLEHPPSALVLVHIYHGDSQAEAREAKPVKLIPERDHNMRMSDQWDVLMPEDQGYSREYLKSAVLIR